MSKKTKAGPLKLSFTIWQRVLLDSILADTEPRTSGHYRKINKAMDIAELSESERKTLKYRPTDDGRSMTWDDKAAESEYPLGFKDREVAHTVRQAALDYPIARWPRRNRSAVLEMWRQLDIYQDDDEGEEEDEEVIE